MFLNKWSAKSSLRYRTLHNGQQATILCICIKKKTLLYVSWGSQEGTTLPRTACGSVDSKWNVIAHGDAREGKWRGNRRMERVASTLLTTSEHGVYNITTNSKSWCANLGRQYTTELTPRRFKWTRPPHRKTKSGFCACAITFQLASTYKHGHPNWTSLSRMPDEAWPTTKGPGAGGSSGVGQGPWELGW